MADLFLSCLAFFFAVLWLIARSEERYWRKQAQHWRAESMEQWRAKVDALRVAQTMKCRMKESVN